MKSYLCFLPQCLSLCARVLSCQGKWGNRSGETYGKAEVPSLPNGEKQGLKGHSKTEDLGL